MLLSLKNTIDKIKQEQLVYWNLYYHKDMSTPVSYAYFNIKDDLDGSITYLQKNVDYLTEKYPNAKFHIKAREKSTGNGNNIIEWDFSLDGSNDIDQFSGFGKMDNHSNMMNNPLLEDVKRKEENLISERFKIQEERMDLRLERYKLETDKKNHEDFVKKTNDEFKGLAAKYSNNTEAAKNGFNLFLGEALKLFNESTGGKSGFLGMLSGTGEETAETEAKSAEQEIVSDIAIMIDECNFNIETLQGLKNFMKKYLENAVNSLKNKEEKEVNNG